MKLFKSKNNIIYGIVCLAVLVVLFVGLWVVNKDVKLLPKKSTNDTSINSSGDEKIVYEAFYELYMSVDYSNKQTLNNEADYIAIVTIDSLSASNWDDLNNEYVSPYTKGSAKVLTTLKGTLPESINYKRLGAEISYNEWIKGDVDPNKIEAITSIDEDNTNVEVDSRMSSDIHLNKGKTYLVFMKQYSCCNVDNEYTIIAFEFGTRELQQQSDISINNVGSMKVKDNTTGEWVNISDVVDFNSIK